MLLLFLLSKVMIVVAASCRPVDVTATVGRRHRCCRRCRRCDCCTALSTLTSKKDQFSGAAAAYLRTKSLLCPSELTLTALQMVSKKKLSGSSAITSTINHKWPKS